MRSGVTLQELNRLFDFLKQSKANDEMTVLITNDMCKSLYDLMENCVKYQDKLQSNWNSLKEWLKNKIDNFQDDVSEPILHEQMTMRVIYEYMENLDKMNELERKDNNE